MPSTSPLFKLPSELRLLVIESCDSPKDVQSLVSADPASLSAYMAYQQSLLRSLAGPLEDRLMDPKLRPDSNPGMIPKAVLAVRLLLIHQKQAKYTFEEYQHAVRVVMSSQINLYQLPPSLPLLCAMSKMMDDMDETIASYRAEELREQQLAALMNEDEDGDGTARSECLPRELDAEERYMEYKKRLHDQSTQHAFSYGGQKVNAPPLYVNLYPAEVYWNALSRAELDNALQ